MGKIFKKLFIAAFCLLAVVGLTGCNTEGLNSDQIDTLVTTLEKSQTFMSEVNDSLDDQINQDKEYVKELKRQNDLKEEEIEVLKNSNKEITKEEAQLLMLEAAVKFNSNYEHIAENVKIDGVGWNHSIYSSRGGSIDEKYSGKYTIGRKAIYDEDGNVTWYYFDLAFDEDGEINLDDSIMCISYDAEKFQFIQRQKYDGDTATGGHEYIYKTENDAAGLIFFDVIFKSTVDDIKSVEVLEDGSVKIKILFTDGDYSGSSFNLDMLVVTIKDGCITKVEGPICWKNSKHDDYGNYELSESYNYSAATLNYNALTDEEVLGYYREIVGDNGMITPILMEEVNKMKTSTKLRIDVSGDDTVYTSLSDIYEVYGYLVDQEKIGVVDSASLGIITNDGATIVVREFYPGSGRSLVFTLNNGTITQIYEEYSETTFTINY